MSSHKQRLSCGLLLLCAGLYIIRRRRKALYSRGASIRRTRLCLSTVVRDLIESEFRRVFRMQKSAFISLLEVLLPDLQRDAAMALRSSGGCIDSEIRLALTLRILAGGSYLDSMILFGISRSSCYATFHGTIESILSRLKLDKLPLSDRNCLDELSQEFSTSRRNSNPLVGWVSERDCD
jgi:hypothetical protein